MKIIWSPLAHQRINEIADYIASGSLAAAERCINSLYDRVKRLKDFPKSGRVVPEVEKDDIREIFFGDYRIVCGIERYASDKNKKSWMRHTMSKAIGGHP